MAQPEWTLLDILKNALRWYNIILEDCNEPDARDLEQNIEAIQAVINNMENDSKASLIAYAEYKTLSNIAWSGIQHLMEDGLDNSTEIDITDVEEAELLLQFKKAVALKVDSLVIRLTTENENATTGTQSPAGSNSNRDSE